MPELVELNKDSVFKHETVYLYVGKENYSCYLLYDEKAFDEYNFKSVNFFAPKFCIDKESIFNNGKLYTVYI